MSDGNLKKTPCSTVSKQRRTPLGLRLDEIRERVKASGQPLLSWEDLNRVERPGAFIKETT